MSACRNALIAQGIDPDGWSDEVRKRLPLLPKVRRAGNRKLTDDQVLEIRETYQRDVVGYRTLANRYGISEWSVRHILAHLTYREVTDRSAA